MEEDIYLVIDSIDLLTEEEAKAVPKPIRKGDGRQPWFLQTVLPKIALTSRGELIPLVIGVTSAGNIDASFGYDVRYPRDIRPALLIKGLDSLKLTVGQELEIFKLPWIYIGNNKVLSKKPFRKDKFDDTSTEYKTSYIKNKLDQWLKDQKKKFDED